MHWTEKFHSTECSPHQKIDILPNEYKTLHYAKNKKNPFTPNIHYRADEYKSATFVRIFNCTTHRVNQK